jgi:hypothetical protein
MTDISTDSPSDAPYDPWDALEAAWGLIANAYDGDWYGASEDWRQAAERWRDNHFLPYIQKH